MIEIIPIGGCKYVAATPICCGFSAVPNLRGYTLRKIAANLIWESAEDFSLNVIRMEDEKRCAEALSIQSPHAPLEGFIAQRNVFTQELASTFPCVPPHQITAEQRGAMRSWFDSEAEKMRKKNPMVAQWSEAMRVRLDEPATADQTAPQEARTVAIPYPPSVRLEPDFSIPVASNETRARASVSHLTPLHAAA